MTKFDDVVCRLDDPSSQPFDVLRYALRRTEIRDLPGLDMRGLKLKHLRIVIRVNKPHAEYERDDGPPPTLFPGRHWSAASLMTYRSRSAESSLFTGQHRVA